MSLYIILGFINTAFIIVSLIGIFSQLKTIWRRRAQQKSGTELLSINQFSVSFLAYFSFFIYGYSIEPFNHFIVWPRLVASVIVAIILYEIWRERRNSKAIVTITITAIIFIGGLAGLLYNNSISAHSQLISSAQVVIITLLLAQGYGHQIMLIMRSGKTGAVDIRMSQFILAMDISTIAFALSMGLGNGWPLLLLASVSASTKIIIIGLFHKYNKTKATH